MNRVFTILILIGLLGCQEDKKIPSAQEIVDKSIQVSGGKKYGNSNIEFDFRKIHYSSELENGQKVLKRRIENDTAVILDVKSPSGFERYINDSLVVLADTTSNKYANSVNSVHYFAYLPYGLNDRAVQKRLLGKVDLNGKSYYKIQVTFKEDGGGDDFDDVYIYWFNADTFKPDYLAYEFHVNGGGQRFREAYNERYVGDIRFVDYKNYKPKLENTTIFNIDSLYLNNQLELLSNIALENVQVNQGSYN
ncbi:DUF6503 family protein [Maribacter cobaltidurans]|uniref:Deoxyribose-phosphate aldolase n=1 Tax=Maribacter cobaltidurans TaxID=1178778 RepID=A0A223V9M8_9FLAO|nr:DUF6503 family protein [Maribacter cobaltidurans]ASV32002.1 deoxyribose-phosphate aldolase [Maribacter cobaltidurans]GGD86363.1 hypothetical protein GCM10011412_25260 [Maribacter cobaltidurans]